MTIDDFIHEQLTAHADSRLAAFNRRLLPGISRHVLGVRIPRLRTLARELALRDDAAAWLAGCRAEATFEEVILHGLLVGRLKADADTWFARVAAYVPLIDNWAACDVPCSSFTAIRRHAGRGWDFLRPYLDSRQEYEQRFGIVMLLDHYTDEAHAGTVVERLAGLSTEAYYARMAQAWALSMCFIKFPEITFPVLAPGVLHPDVRRMTLQKIMESRRLGDAWRETIQKMRQIHR